MELPKNIVSFLKSLPLKDMHGDDVFVAVVFFLSSGNCDTEIEIKAVKKNWQKSVTGKKYNPAFFTRAQGRIHPINVGRLVLTEEGVSYIQKLMGEIPTYATTLLVFKQGNAHSFDKFLRSILKKAIKGVNIADTYVDGSLFDTLLDEIPKAVPICFVYGKDTGGFIQRAGRFSAQYKIIFKESKQFHDRFLIVDGKGYIIGPSLKDAAEKKPATVVVLNADDSKKLIDLFAEIWKTAK